MLLDQYVSLVEESCRAVFARPESRRRAIEHAIALPCTLGVRTISRTVCTLGREQATDWSAEYKLSSRSPWAQDELFAPVLQERVARFPGLIGVALDDTRLRRWGKHIPYTGWHRDPLSPPFHTNLLYGIRILHAAVLFPHYAEPDRPAPCRGIPVRFRPAPAPQKPGKHASPEQWQAYRHAQKTENLSLQAVALLGDVREQFDQEGAEDRVLVSAMDGSFCNRNVFRTPIAGVVLLARARKDARLCYPAPVGSRRTYDAQHFTPEAVRHDARIGWRTARVYLGGKMRTVRYKTCSGVLWQRGAGRRRLRLFVLAPQPYKISVGSRTYYRQPAYLLCTDLESPAQELIQIYVDRWQIEVNHREQKSLMGVGDAQVRSLLSVPRHPAFAVACYSLLLLAGMREFGPAWRPEHFPLPRWRNKVPLRPSALDLLTRLRADLHETRDSRYCINNIKQNLTRHAYT